MIYLLGQNKTFGILCLSQQSSFLRVEFRQAFKAVNELSFIKPAFRDDIS